MSRDPIIDEVRTIRDDIAREHNYDLNSIFRMLRRHESRGSPHVKFSPKRLRLGEGHPRPTEAAQHGVAAGRNSARKKRSPRVGG